jgi:hypothetical protein
MRARVADGDDLVEGFATNSASMSLFFSKVPVGLNRRVSSAETFTC